MEALMNGRSFEVAAEPADFWGWVREGRYDREWKVMDEHLRPEHTFLDLGAWVGSHTLYASRIVRRVIAFEPDPVAFRILKSNVPMIEAWEVAVSNHTGMIELGSGLLGASTTRANHIAGGGIGPWENGQTFWSKCATLRHLVEKLEIEDPLFIKMDVEGSEEDILEDVEFFREHKPILYLETHPFWWRDESVTRKCIEEISRHCMVIQ